MREALGRDSLKKRGHPRVSRGDVGGKKRRRLPQKRRDPNGRDTEKKRKGRRIALGGPGRFWGEKERATMRLQKHRKGGGGPSHCTSVAKKQRLKRKGFIGVAEGKAPPRGTKMREKEKCAGPLKGGKPREGGGSSQRKKGKGVETRKVLEGLLV